MATEDEAKKIIAELDDGADFADAGQAEQHRSGRQERRRSRLLQEGRHGAGIRRRRLRAEAGRDHPDAGAHAVRLARHQGAWSAAPRRRRPSSRRTTRLRQKMIQEDVQQAGRRRRAAALTVQKFNIGRHADKRDRHRRAAAARQAVIGRPRWTAHPLASKTRSRTFRGGSPWRSPVSPLAVALPALPPIAGVRLGAAAAGIRYQGRTDLVMVELAAGTTVAGVFTPQMPRRAGGLVPRGAASRAGARAGGECRQRQRLHRPGRARGLRARPPRPRRQAGRLPGAAGVPGLHRRDRRGAAARAPDRRAAGAARRPVPRMGGKRRRAAS